MRPQNVIEVPQTCHRKAHSYLHSKISPYVSQTLFCVLFMSLRNKNMSLFFLIKEETWKAFPCDRFDDHAMNNPSGREVFSELLIKQLLLHRVVVRLKAMQVALDICMGKEGYVRIYA